MPNQKTSVKPQSFPHFLLIRTLSLTILVAAMVMRYAVQILWVPVILHADLTPEGLAHAKFINTIVIYSPFLIFLGGALYFYKQTYKTYTNKSPVIGFLIILAIGFLTTFILPPLLLKSTQ